LNYKRTLVRILDPNGRGRSVHHRIGIDVSVLSAQVPTTGANADINAQLTYYLEVVPNSGSLTPAAVLLGVNATGSSTLNTTGGTDGNPTNSGNSFLGLQVTSNSGGAPSLHQQGNLAIPIWSK
jgi:hypothetical protein